jgi:hypothetical protein
MTEGPKRKLHGASARPKCLGVNLPLLRGSGAVLRMRLEVSHQIRKSCLREAHLNLLSQILPWRVQRARVMIVALVQTQYAPPHLIPISPGRQYF